MSRKDHILHLVVYKTIFEMLVAKEKPVEYRKIDYWKKIVMNRGFTHVRFQCGFRKDPETGKVPTIILPIEKIDIGAAESRWVAGVLPAGKEFIRIWVKHDEPKAVLTYTPIE